MGRKGSGPLSSEGVNFCISTDHGCPPQPSKPPPKSNCSLSSMLPLPDQYMAQKETAID
jgi:hypothetical protein